MIFALFSFFWWEIFHSGPFSLNSRVLFAFYSVCECGGGTDPPHTHTHYKAKKRKNSTLEFKENGQKIRLLDVKNVNNSKNRLTPAKLESKKQDKKNYGLAGGFRRGDPIDFLGRTTSHVLLLVRNHLLQIPHCAHYIFQSRENNVISLEWNVLVLLWCYINT